jgi:hypothetical protein
MNDGLRRHALVQVKVTVAERDRWLRVALANQMRLVELVREAVRHHVRELERLALLGRTAEPDAAAAPATGKVA